jgi:hypothetical protein
MGLRYLYLSPLHCFLRKVRTESLSILRTCFIFEVVNFCFYQKSKAKKIEEHRTRSTFTHKILTLQVIHKQKIFARSSFRGTEVLNCLKRSVSIKTREFNPYLNASLLYRLSR